MDRGFFLVGVEDGLTRLIGPFGSLRLVRCSVGNGELDGRTRGRMGKGGEWRGWDSRS